MFSQIEQTQNFSHNHERQKKEQKYDFSNVDQALYVTIGKLER